MTDNIFVAGDIARARHVLYEYQFISIEHVDAAVLGAQGRLRDLPVPETGPGEVLVKVGGAGAWHSELHLLELPAGARSFTLPLTLGHENAGWVEKMGPGTTGFTRGDPVIGYGPWGCGLCMNCRKGMENYCEARANPIPAGWAEPTAEWPSISLSRQRGT